MKTLTQVARNGERKNANVIRSKRKGYRGKEMKNILRRQGLDSWRAGPRFVRKAEGLNVSPRSESYF